jgi:hypothetical protein
MRKKVIIVFLLSVFFAGCATSPRDKGFSLAGHKAFEVAPVLNATGKAFDFDVTSQLTGLISSKLKEKELSVTATLENAIIIKSSVTSYETRGARAQCTVEIKFVDKTTQRVLGEIVTSKTISVGGLSSVELNSDQAILEAIANDIVFEVEKRIKHEPLVSP